mmetsp:Transcript_29007/g.34473  ORF Transcript_29007/g.34473 Transcript_29007/m.34473 type:complete len:175 (-) Transcript_29007:209-733(-)
MKFYCSATSAVNDASNDSVEKSHCSSNHPSMATLTDMSTSSSSSDDETQHVHFQSVEIREYDMILGDHPSSHNGPPVTLDWEYDETILLPLDQYEFHHAPRRTKQQMLLDGSYRAHILINCDDYTDDEMIKAENDCKKIQKQRDSTIRMLPFSKMEEVTQSAGRKLKRLQSKHK